VRLRHPLVFFVIPTCRETCFPSCRYSTYFFLLLFIFWIIIPAILPATMLGYYSMSASLMPSEFFHRRIDLLEVSSYRSSLDLSSFSKITNRLAAKLTCSFFIRPTCMLFDMPIDLRLRCDLYKFDVPTPRSGACETWVPLGPHQPCSRPSPTSGSGLPEDPPTCQWAQPA
jgi:hypothetical protein